MPCCPSCHGDTGDSAAWVALELPSPHQPKPTPARGHPQVLPWGRKGDLFPRPKLTKAGPPPKGLQPTLAEKPGAAGGDREADCDLSCLREGLGKDLFGEQGGGGGLKLSLGKGEEGLVLVLCFLCLSTPELVSYGLC